PGWCGAFSHGDRRQRRARATACLCLLARRAPLSGGHQPGSRPGTLRSPGSQDRRGFLESRRCSTLSRHLTPVDTPSHPVCTGIAPDTPRTALCAMVGGRCALVLEGARCRRGGVVDVASREAEKGAVTASGDC